MYFLFVYLWSYTKMFGTKIYLYNNNMFWMNSPRETQLRSQLP